MALADAHIASQGRKGKKKKKKEEAAKKIPKMFNYLFHKGGLEEKDIQKDPDGWVVVGEILDQEMYSDYTEDEVLEALTDSKEFEVRVSSDCGMLLVRSVISVESNVESDKLPKSAENVAEQSEENRDILEPDSGEQRTSKRRNRKKVRGHSVEEDKPTVLPLAGSADSDTKHQRQGDQGNDVFISKTLSWLLRHGAEKAGFRFQDGGFLYVEEVLHLPKFRGRVTFEDIQRVVDNNMKKRFHLEPHPENGKPRIRANQGHSVQVDGLVLSPITSATDYPVVVHGTYRKNWPSIKQQGLKRMNRTHIHFAPGEPSDSGVISGMRGSCDVLIFIDLASALADGHEFVISANNVILCPGDATGCLPPQYFKEVVDRRTRQSLL